MTTQEDWAFRAQYFVDAAKRLEIKAAEMMKEAAELRAKASKINPTSCSPGYTQYTGYRP